MEPATHQPDAPADRRGARWWPAVAIIALAATGLIINALREASRQEKVMVGIPLGLLAGVALLLWAMLLSRFRASTRLAILGSAVAILILAFATIEIRGVYGDIVPIFGWRWSQRPAPPAVVIDASNEPAPAPSGAGDWPQFLGPDRNPAVPGPELSRDWSSAPPREVWRRPIGQGWSGFAVVGGRAVTQEQRGDEEWITCYELATGRLLWTHSETARFVDQTGGTISGIGPRATPTIDSDRVYTLGATGLLHCLDLATGERLWSRDAAKENGASPPEWGYAGSPLLIDGKVVVNIGGRPGRSLVAYEALTGESVWQAGDDRVSYSSPMRAQIGGAEQIIVLNHNSVAAHHPADGTVLWRTDWPGGEPKVAQPLVIADDRVFVSSGYGVGAAMFHVTRSPSGAFEVAMLWKNLSMKAKFSNMVFRDGSVYGLDDGILACVDAATGDRRWKGGRYGHGQLILIGDLLLVQSESGELVLVEATPSEHRELSRIRIFDHKTWNTPALAGHYLLLRTDHEAACYRLSTELRNDASQN